MTPLLLTPEEAAEALRVGRTEVFNLLRRGEIESIVIGQRRRRIPVDALEAYVERIRRDQAEGAGETRMDARPARLAGASL